MASLLHQINRLSIADTKTISQKALKLTEETGELAKAVLPMEGARGTNHRIPSRDKIAEECADVILVAYSILKGLRTSDEEIIQTIQRKTDYWEFLIDNEDRHDISELDFEIHLTVDKATDIEQFKRDCSSLSVKPIILDLYTGGEAIKDVMTSSQFRGSTAEVIDHMKGLSEALSALGYNVVREKIESTPWHPAALVPHDAKSAYFEAHFAFKNESNSFLKNFCETRGIHLSKNMMKKGEDSVVMGTYRVDALKTDAESFQARIAAIHGEAAMMGIEITKRPHTEYSIFDTNEKHDYEWITAKR